MIQSLINLNYNIQSQIHIIKFIIQLIYLEYGKKKIPILIQEITSVQNENENENENNPGPTIEYKLRGAVLIYKCVIILLLIIESIISIVICTKNQDQAQIYYAALINALIQIINLLLFLCLIRSSQKFHDKLIQFFPQEQIKEYIIDDQKQHVPIHYFIIYSNIIQILLVYKFEPTSEPDCSHTYVDDEGHSCCYSIQIPPQFSGYQTEGYADSIIVQTALILIYELILGYCQLICLVKKFDQRVEIVNNALQNQSFILLILFILYSCFKIIIYIVLLSTGENSSSTILILSNIYFHIIMILICSRAFYLIYQDKKCEMYDYFNYFAPVNDIFMTDKFCWVLFIFSGLSLVITITGLVIHKVVDAKVIFDWNYFIFFDCGGVQIFTISIIFIWFILMPCCCCVRRARTNRIFDEVQQSQSYIQQQVQTQEIQRMKQQQQIQNQLPPFMQQVNYKGNNDCTICLQRMIENKQQIIVQLKCHKTHIFHFECIQQWLDKHKKCPICNQPQGQS